MLAAQQHIDAVIAALLASRGQPAETAALQQYLDDACAVARAAVSAVNGTAAPPAAAIAVLEELGARPGPGAAASALASRSGGPRRQLAPVTAFGVTIADVMLHGRHDDPDPVIAGWLAGNTASRRSTTSPADVLAHWDQASPALQAALARPLAARLDTFYQLRYRAVAGPARIPDPARAQERAAALPSLMWPGWALRLMPPEGFDFLPYRAALAMMLAIAVTGAEDYRTAQDLLGLEPFHSSRLATFTARLREHGILEQVTAALCQLARKLEEHGAPVDYARRRRLRRFSQARLDTDSWRRQRYFLTHPATWAQRRHLDHADLPAAPVQEQLARLRLIELLTGTHPRYLPGPLRLPERRSQDYAEFVFTMPEQMACCLHRQARALLVQGRSQRARHLGTPVRLGRRHPLARPGPRRHQRPKTCTRSSAPGCPSAPSPPGSPPPPTTSGWQRPATRRPSSRREPRAAPGRTGTTRHRTAPRPHQPGIRRPQDRPHHRMQRAHHQAAPHQRRAPPPGPAPGRAASTRTGSASSTRTASAASKTSPPRPASPSRPSPPQPARPASASGTASTAAPTPSPPSADPARSPRTSGTPSPTPAPSSASEGSSPSPASPASSTQPASSASGPPSSPARSASSRPPSAPHSCAPDQTGSSR